MPSGDLPHNYREYLGMIVLNESTELSKQRPFPPGSMSYSLALLSLEILRRGSAPCPTPSKGMCRVNYFDS